MVSDITQKLIDLVSKRSEKSNNPEERSLDSAIATETVPSVESSTDSLKKLASKGTVKWPANRVVNNYFINPERDDYSSPIINEIKKKYHK